MRRAAIWELHGRLSGGAAEWGGAAGTGVKGPGVACLPIRVCSAGGGAAPGVPWDPGPALRRPGAHRGGPGDAGPSRFNDKSAFLRGFEIPVKSRDSGENIQFCEISCA